MCKTQWKGRDGPVFTKCTKQKASSRDILGGALTEEAAVELTVLISG